MEDEKQHSSHHLEMLKTAKRETIARIEALQDQGDYGEKYQEQQKLLLKILQQLRYRQELT